MPTKWSSILIVALIFPALLISCSQQTSDPEYERLKARAQNVTIIRDDFGVPHVYAKTDADAVFGMLYVQSEDDFNRVEQNYIWATGRLAEVEGADALVSDLRARLYMTTDEAKAAYQSAPEWLRQLCDAFADGINWYLATHPEVKPRLLTRFEPWMPMFFSEGWTALTRSITGMEPPPLSLTPVEHSRSPVDQTVLQYRVS
jgi:acyl-homoserine lactone acylase PvdQ